MAKQFHLDFSQGFGPSQRQMQTTPNPSQEAGITDQQLYSSDIMAQMTNHGIQMDEQGMADAFYDSIAGIREYAIEMDMMGIDVVEGYDFRNPLARDASSLFRSAAAQHNQNARMLIEGARNLQFARDEMAAGRMIGNINELNSGGPLSTRGLMENTFSTNLQDIDRYNQVIAGSRPTSQAEYDALVKFREEAASEILARMTYQGSPDEATLFLERHLAEVPRYDPLEDELKRAQTARAWQQYRGQKADESFIDPRLGELVDAYMSWASTNQYGSSPGNQFRTDVLKGSGFQGKDSFILDDIYIDGNGDGKAVFAANPAVKMSKQEEVFNGKSLAQDVSSTYSDGKIVVDFDESNVANLMASIMSEEQYKKLISNLARAGGYDNSGRLSMKDLTRVIGPNNDKTEKQNTPPAPLNLSPFTTAQKGVNGSGRKTFGLK